MDIPDQLKEAAKERAIHKRAQKELSGPPSLSRGNFEGLATRAGSFISFVSLLGAFGVPGVASKDPCLFGEPWGTPAYPKGPKGRDQRPSLSRGNFEGLATRARPFISFVSLLGAFGVPGVASKDPCLFGEPWGTPAYPKGPKQRGQRLLPYLGAILKAWPQEPGPSLAL